MAFNKRTWKGRQGTGLNKFSINGATPVTVINQPDSVTEQGDALSAVNLNDLEDRIYDAFDDIADGTQVVGKANADASGNVIDQTYETKADASELESAIDNNSQRIENLEVAVSGSLVQTNTDSTMANTKTITNANSILPWAILKRVGARAVSWNQPLLGGINTFTINGVTFTNNQDGSITLTGTASAQISEELFTQYASFLPNHKYAIYGLKSATGISYGVKGYSVNNPSDFIFSVASAWSHGLAIRILSGTNTNGLRIYPMVSDLTAMNEYDSTLTDAQNIAKFRAKFPASYYPYNAGEIIPLNPSGFKVVKFNQFNGSFVQGTINGNTGIIADSYYRVTSDMFKAIGGEKYSFNVNTESSGIITVFECAEYDPQQNFIKLTTITGRESSLTLSSNTAYIRVSFKKSNGNTITPSELNGVFCANIFCSKNGQYEPYSEQTIDTSFTSDYKYVNENCHDYSENVLVDGEMRREEHIVAGEDVISNANVAIDTVRTNTTRAVFVLTTSKPVAYSDSKDTVPNLMMVGFTPAAQNTTWTSGMISSRFEDKLIYIITDPAITLDSFLTTYGGHKVLYEVAESTSLHDPIPNIPCEDGTTVQAVTPQTDLVNSIDVPSTIAYMTKIAS